jgi:hypothetical protein
MRVKMIFCQALRRPRFRRRQVCLIFLLAAAVFLAPSPLQCARSPFDVDARAGVSAEQVKYLSLAVSDVFKFFMANYNIALHKRMLLIVVPDNETYASVLAKDLKMTGARAQKMSHLSGGIATESRDRYILAVKAGAKEPMDAIMTKTCHEMVHWFQYREASHEKSAQHAWIVEGVANVIAFHIVESHISGSYDHCRQYYAALVQKANQTPALAGLESGRAWEGAMEKYGGSVLYGKATLATMELAQRTGIKSLFGYFRHLKRQTPEKAFRLAFNLNLKDFEKEIDQKYGKQREPTPQSASRPSKG